MIYVMGDFHAHYWPVQELLKKSKSYVEMILQCGDFGYFPNFYNVPKLQTYGIPLYFCDGNHEDFRELKKLENNEVYENIFYQKRGSVLTLPDGRNVLFFGGARSIDKDLRTPGIDWFPDEEITQRDIIDLPINVEIDVVISHTCPIEFDLGIDESRFPDPSRLALSVILEEFKPRFWYFGHFHKYARGIFNHCQWTALDMTSSHNPWCVELEG